MINIWLRIVLTVAALVACLNTGCVQRRILVRSYPEGALVTIDRQPVGHTPVAVPFTYYGTREIEIEKDGFQSRKVKHRFTPPWWQIPPFDFISENLWPKKLRDDRVIDFQLAPLTTVDENRLLERAGLLRSNVYRNTIPMPLSSQQPADATVVSQPSPTDILPRSILSR